MNIDVYKLDGSSGGSLALPAVFSTAFRSDLVRRAILSEQSASYQHQGHSEVAGMQTTAVYVGKYSGYRHGRHMGIAIRPRQKLGGGAMGDVRRIPSSVKGRRAHPHKAFKIIQERMNSAERLAAIRSAIGGCINPVHKGQAGQSKPFPIVVENSIESLLRSKELVKLLSALGFSGELEGSHRPRLSHNSRRSSKRHFRRSLLIIVSDDAKIGRAGRNIPGVEILNIKRLSAESLAPGCVPRISIWSRSAVEGIEEALLAYR